MSVIKSRYSILSNKPLTEEFSGELNEISYELPAWFKNSNKRKIIKVYGCSFRFLESEDKKPIPSDYYTNHILSVHSNIARDETEHMASFYPQTNSKTPDIYENEAVDCFMMIVNNYYTPKIYDVTDSNLQTISIWFKDSYGNRVPIRSSYSGSGGLLDEIRQAVFKIECELAVL
jgi:hypothetical protein